MAATAITRSQAITDIRAALRRRSGKSWSVTGGRGTAYGWIYITSPAARRESSRMSRADCQELHNLLGLAHEYCLCHRQLVGDQNIQVPAGPDYYAEYIDRAAGREPRVLAHPYWD